MCRKRLSTLLLALSLLLPFGSTVQAEAMYTISETELTKLESNLQTLEQHNKIKQQLLIEQQEKLTIANQQLAKAKNDLNKSRTLNEQTQKSLQSANRSLQKLEEEAKCKIKVKSRQRNLWIIVSGGLLYALISR